MTPHHKLRHDPTPPTIALQLYYTAVPLPLPPATDTSQTVASLETTVVQRIERALPLQDLVLEVRPRFAPLAMLEFEAGALSQLFSKALFGLIVTGE